MVTFELSGGKGSGKEYSAFAFAEDHDMMNTDVYYCTGEELKSAVVRGEYSPPVELNEPVCLLDYLFGWSNDLIFEFLYRDFFSHNGP